MATLQSAHALAAALLGELDALTATAGPVYRVRTDRDTLPLPATLPTLGPAGSRFTDPIFGTERWRVTDEHTDNGGACRVASNTSLASWNADGSKFFVMGAGGSTLIHAFDPVAQTLQRLPVSIAPEQLEPSFSYSNPDRIYGVVQHTVKAWDLASGAVEDVFDHDSLGLDLSPDTYIGGLVTSDHAFVTIFGGFRQDGHYYVRHSGGALLDTRPLGFKVHAAILERDGPNVIVFPATDPRTGQMPRGITQIQVWNTTTGIVTQVNTAWGGHASVGYGDLINADIVPGTPWTALQWVTRKLAALDSVRNLIDPILPGRAYPVGGISDHQNYRHARPDRAVPIVSSTYRWGGFAGEWQPWDDEILGLAPDGTVYRFGHNYSSGMRVGADFWSQPIVSVRPQGDYAIYTSNHGGAVGAGRQDVFLIRLAA